MSPFGPVGVGYKGKLLIAHETTYDTAPAASDYGVEIMSATITPKLSVITDPSMSPGQLSPRFIGQGGQTLEASFRFRTGYEGLLPILRLFLPGYASAAVDTSARDHTLKEGSAVAPISHALDFLWGDVPTGKANRLTGCYGQNLRLSWQAGTGDNAMITGEAKVIGRTLTPNSTPMTGGALPAALGVIYHQLQRTSGNLKDGSTTAFDAIPITSWELGIDHPFDQARFLGGDINAQQPIRNAMSDYSMSFEEEWQDVNLMAAARADSATALKLLFQHPTIIGAVSAKRELEFIANDPTPAEYETALPGFGKITQRCSYKLAYVTADASPLLVRVRSTETAMTF